MNCSVLVVEWIVCVVGMCEREDVSYMSDSGYCHVYEPYMG